MNENIAALRAKAQKIPTTPGVYIMKDSRGKIIYIGKAKSLKNRVGSYFAKAANHYEKTARMVELVDDFDYILCDNESESLLLECALIKQHKPKFNILLRYTKRQNYIKITKPPFVKISMAFEKVDDGATYLGPYYSGPITGETINAANSVFGLATCNKKLPDDIGKSRTCLNYHLKKCSGICAKKISVEDYEKAGLEAIKYVKSGEDAVLETLKTEMQKASEDLDFERAAKIRDKIELIKRLYKRAKVVINYPKDLDVVAMARSPKNICFEIFHFKNGTLADAEHFIVDGQDDEKAARAEFLRRYYSQAVDVPKMLILDGETDDNALLKDWLSAKSGGKVTIAVPKSGIYKNIAQMCKNNAAERLAQKRTVISREKSNLDELAALLGFKTAPQIIEAYDISHHAGDEIVGSMVVFKNGTPAKKHYRTFKVKTLDNADDYAALREVLSRRFARLNTDDISFGQTPNLVLIDGGIGQLNAVMPAITEIDSEIHVFGMVKDAKHKTRGLISQNGDEIALKATRGAFSLVTNIQNEAHRFALKFHHNRKRKSTLSSRILQIDGVGKSKADALLKHFKTMANLKKANVDELQKVQGISEKLAQNIEEYFRKNL